MQVFALRRCRVQDLVPSACEDFEVRRQLPLVKVRNEREIAAAAAVVAAIAVRRAIAAAQLANWHEVKEVYCVHVRAPREHRRCLGRVTETQYWEPKWFPSTGSHRSEASRLYPVGLLRHAQERQG